MTSLISLLIGLLMTHATAQEKKPANKPGMVMVDGASITATVEAIDYEKRTVALKEAEAMSSCSNSART